MVNNKTKSTHKEAAKANTTTKTSTKTTTVGSKSTTTTVATKTTTTTVLPESTVTTTVTKIATTTASSSALLITETGVKGSYWDPTSDAGGCELPVASYAFPHGAFALGDIATLSTLTYTHYYCGQIFQLDCGHGPVNAVVASTCNIGQNNCGVDMIAATWNATTDYAAYGQTTCSVSLTDLNPISTSSAPICYYRANSEFSNQWYKLLGILNTSGKLVVGASLGGIVGSLSSANWYQFQSTGNSFVDTDPVIFTYADGTSSTFTLGQCIQPTGVQIFS
ncbi:hypothetical protein HK100_002483 [Physocladia obscura]|uniref:Uncharacterized protein n=1 Tax=Physocladia obscura TaxID=109957 RepID=A0AAD5SVB4_9FUNG|nr:hypothetical protein HK100_002483 [Physocladia obscura]